MEIIAGIVATILVCCLVAFSIWNFYKIILTLKNRKKNKNSVNKDTLVEDNKDIIENEENNTTLK